MQGYNVEIKADLTPLINTLANGVGLLGKGAQKIVTAVLPETLIQRIQDREKASAQHKYDVEQIHHGNAFYDSGRHSLTSLIQEEEEKNLVKAISKAVEFAQDIPETQFDSKPLNKSFANRWRREAEIIDDESIREIWARLLVEETKSTGSISPATLEIVKLLTPDDARAFTQLTRSWVHNQIMSETLEESSLQSPINGGISHDELARLVDLGLISEISVIGIGLVNSFKAKKEGINRIQLMIPKPDMMVSVSFQDTFSYNVITLTTQGKNLMKIVEPVMTQSDLNHIVEELNKISGVVDAVPNMILTGQKLPQSDAFTFTSKHTTIEITIPTINSSEGGSNEKVTPLRVNMTCYAMPSSAT